MPDEVMARSLLETAAASATLPLFKVEEIE
jgi:hypothetical protein